MLRKFKIKIDGQEYLVEMEEIGGTPQVAPVQAPVVAATTPVAEPAKETVVAEPTTTQVPQATVQADADAMLSPMPGTILKILVQPGDTVKENQPVLILEAMKMENEIVATQAGTVTGIHVTQGDIVNPGEPLLTIN